MRGPTVRPATRFEPKFDAEKLRESFHYVGGNEADVVDILCRRSNEQRQEICRAYKELVGDELVEDIKNAIDGEYRDLVVGLCQPPAEFYAWELHRAIKDNRGKVIVEILCTLDNREIDGVKDAYRRTFGNSAVEDIRFHSRYRKNSIFQRLLTEKRKEDAGTNVEELRKLNGVLSAVPVCTNSSIEDPSPTRYCCCYGDVCNVDEESMTKPRTGEENMAGSIAYRIEDFYDRDAVSAERTFIRRVVNHVYQHIDGPSKDSE